jgi:cobalt-zinc-cadmium resistance protein CzcA
MLMTALSARTAAFLAGVGSQMQRPLVTVVAGGMLLGPVMLLAVVPALQLMFLSSEEHHQPKPRAKPRNAHAPAQIPSPSRRSPSRGLSRAHGAT